MSKQLTDELNELVEKGIELSERSRNIDSLETASWAQVCRSVLISLYGNGSDEERRFKKSPYLEGKLKTLQVLAAKEGVKQPSTEDEISLRILMNIEHSGLTPDEKNEIKEIFVQVKNEVQKPSTDWKKVTDLLKMSLDYGFKVAPDIIKLADVYYRLKSGK